VATKRNWAYRLKEARLAAGLSQKALGIAASIDPFVASSRINRYELGVHEPDHQTATRLAKALGVPTAYLFCEDDELAEVIQYFHKLPAAKKLSAKKMLLKLQNNE
jgi:transcriptional regulator with XRE-family HTH domain